MTSKTWTMVGVILGIPLLMLLLIIAVIDEEENAALAPGCSQAGGAVTGGDRLAPAGSFIKPVDPSTVTLSSGFGPRWGTVHQGIDLAGPEGTPIYAAGDGVVAVAGTASGFGHWIVIDHPNVDGQMTSTVYGHMYAEGVLVNEGDQVRAGQHIANIGNDGGSTGAHLHWEVWPGGRLSGGQAVDPQPLYDSAPAPGQAPAPAAPDVDSDADSLAGAALPAPNSGDADLSTPVPASIGSEANLQADSVRLMRAVHTRYPQITTIGGWRANGGGVADHPDGRAIDIMIPSFDSGTGMELGNQIRDWVLANADTFGVEYVIWRQTYYQVGQAGSAMEDRGSPTENHMNHVHVTVAGGGAPSSSTVWGTAPQGTAPAPAVTGTCENGSVAGESGTGADVQAGSVPPEFLPWLQKAGAMCPQIKPSLLAAQIKQESAFNPQAVSSSGAQGPAQFMPGTWPNYGQDDDGNGTVSPFDIGDAVMAQGRFMCGIATTIDQAVTDGKVADPNGREELYLAGYNAGPGAVLSAGGMPSGGDYTTQTQPYAERILSMEPGFRSTTAS